MPMLGLLPPWLTLESTIHAASKSSSGTAESSSHSSVPLAGTDIDSWQRPFHIDKRKGAPLAEGLQTTP